MEKGNVRISQLLPIFIIVAAAILIYYRRKMSPRIPQYSDPIVSSKAPVPAVDKEEAITDSKISNEAEYKEIKAEHAADNAEGL
jgi:phosphatidylglycerol:prolipoprotein diacylglycerol transferase